MINTIIFDLGAVLIDWNPQHLYRKLMADDEQRQYFLDNICTSDWNEEQDARRSLADGTEFLVSKHPEHEENIRAFYSRWDEMLAGPIQGTVDIFKALKESGKYKIYALSNWSAETFEIAQREFDFLNWFDGMVVSGVEKIRKPDPAFYNLLLTRYQVKPEEAVFIDDNYRNILAAEALGIQSVHFTSADELSIALRKLSVL